MPVKRLPITPEVSEYLQLFVNKIPSTAQLPRSTSPARTSALSTSELTIHVHDPHVLHPFINPPIGGLPPSHFISTNFSTFTGQCHLITAMHALTPPPITPYPLPRHLIQLATPVRATLSIHCTCPGSIASTHKSPGPKSLTSAIPHLALLPILFERDPFPDVLPYRNLP